MLRTLPAAHIPHQYKLIGSRISTQEYKFSTRKPGGQKHIRGDTV